MRNPNWTATDDATVQRLRATGLDTETIGLRLGRTPDAVRRRLNWIKLSTEERRSINANRSDRRHRLTGEARP